ncbi:MAG TPA: hypothetical protein VD793_01430 [Gemmatimonadales bacterium]|nr:hypothetical protein [Gemmatimonadales bacterium]
MQAERSREPTSNWTRCAVVVLVAGLASNGAGRPQSAACPWGLNAFLGTWAGEGTNGGQQADFRLEWRCALRDHHLSLTYWFARRTAGSTPFEGLAWYRPHATASPGYAGTWFDSQGNTYRLSARLRGDSLVVEWGEGSPVRGQSSYVLGPDGTLMVEDAVQGRDGRWSAFNRSLLRRPESPGR